MVSPLIDTDQKVSRVPQRVLCTSTKSNSFQGTRISTRTGKKGESLINVGTGNGKLVSTLQTKTNRSSFFNKRTHEPPRPYLCFVSRQKFHRACSNSSSTATYSTGQLSSPSTGPVKRSIGICCADASVYPSPVTKNDKRADRHCS